MISQRMQIQGSVKRFLIGLVNFVPAVAYHFSNNLPAVFMKSGRSLMYVES